MGDPVQIPIFDTSTIDWSLNPDMTTAYKNILTFRNTSDAVKEGTILSFSNSPDVAAFERISGTDTVLVMVNVRNASVNYNLDISLQNTTWKDAQQNDKTVQLGSQITLPAYAYSIFHQ
ncbi:MAG TPA: alpha-glucosidase C-terminal domain-containing protein [Hanamia sp.]